MQKNTFLLHMKKIKINPPFFTQINHILNKKASNEKNI